MKNLKHQFIPVNHLNLHVVTAGPEDGEPIILLHGFPEFWYGWHNQIEFLAENGYRVIVPDQRGYNQSDKPKGLKNYHLDRLMADVIGLIDYFGYETVYLAGHDWGAIVSWWVATHHPERLKKLAILNVPYLSVVRQSMLKGNILQALKSWYVLFFQLPWLPEFVIRTVSRRTPFMLDMSSHPTTFSDEDKELYLEALHQPGAVTGMINWYRALRLVRDDIPAPEPGLIKTPTLILWGEQDVALSKELAEMSLALCENGRLHFFPKATHWVQHDEAEAVNKHLRGFFN
ncbi:MAG: alpha/beta hydrolase [Chloroflexota bacterium]